jgi:hypothetical protein
MIMRRVLPFFAVSALLLTIGCGGGGNNVPGGASNVYVVQNGSTSSILEFPASALSSATPSNTITIPMQTTFDAVAVDASGNLYVSASVVTAPSTLYEVLVYAPGATGAATPTRSITNFSTNITSIAVDSTGQLYALSGNTISVFAANATGNATPVRRITGGATLLSSPYSLAVDSAQNIYVANTAAENIVVFSTSANGNVAPSRTISGSNTQLYNTWGIAVDDAGDIFATTQNTAASPAVSTVLEFAPNANGNALPTMTLTDFASDPIAGIQVDAAGNLYVLVIDNNLMTVDVFSAGASGGRAPEQNINSTAWTNSNFGQIAIQ